MVGMKIKKEEVTGLIKMRHVYFKKYIYSAHELIKFVTGCSANTLL